MTEAHLREVETQLDLACSTDDYSTSQSSRAA
jgi:hypothetical protein